MCTMNVTECQEVCRWIAKRTIKSNRINRNKRSRNFRRDKKVYLEGVVFRRLCMYSVYIVQRTILYTLNYCLLAKMPELPCVRLCMMFGMCAVSSIIAPRTHCFMKFNEIFLQARYTLNISTKIRYGEHSDNKRDCVLNS